MQNEAEITMQTKVQRMVVLTTRPAHMNVTYSTSAIGDAEKHNYLVLSKQ